MDKTRFISNFDIARFNSMIQGDSTAPTYIVIDENFPAVDDLFPQQTFYHFLFKKNPNSPIGHWTVLIKFNDSLFEYFDSLADPVPKVIEDRFRAHSVLHNLHVILTENGKQLMDDNETICGKYCIARILSLPHTGEDFIKIFKKWKGKPDDLIKLMINIPFATLED